MIYEFESQVVDNDAVKEEAGRIVIKDKELFCEKEIYNLLATIVSDQAPEKLRKLSCWVAHQAAIRFNAISSSTQGLYKAIGREEVFGFTVPAINIRTLTFDLSCAAFRAAKNLQVGALIFEIAKSEIDYTRQSPLEYSSVVLLAAIKEGYQGPVFLQGDHFQVDPLGYYTDPEKELDLVKALVKEAVDSGFYNIDIDSSTLVDLDKENIDEQQKINYEVCALLTKYIRSIQPKGIEISIGGEIGEVGGKNSTPEEMHSFMNGYTREIDGLQGISRMSIQTGTSHGGVVLPDGTIARVNLDFATLKDLSEIGRKEYGISGCVQHGASTLPNEAFHHFLVAGCSEIHLATGFQNVVYDYFPLTLKEKIYDWLHTECAGERKPEHTNDQFIYRTRKKALGPFKNEINSLTWDIRKKIAKALEAEFEFLFEQLGVKDTVEVVNEYVKVVPIEIEKEVFLKEDKKLD